MTENFFKEFVDLVKDSIWQEFAETDEYREGRNKRVKVSDEIIERLGSDKLMDEYFAVYSDLEAVYEYFLCEKILKAFVHIMAAAGVI